MVFVITVAAAEAAVALALAVLLYRLRETVDVDRIDSAEDGEVRHMWAKFMDMKNGYTAEIWKELLDAEALSVRIVPASAG